MKTLKILLQNETVQETKIRPGMITIGREPDNDIQIDDHTISGHHARFFTYREASYIEDLGSTNGTYINGRKIRMHVVKPGDEILIGKHILKLENRPQQNSAVA
jgi:pSer/pThr/pTyr-binding forkhead associated (FHA) protein